MSTQRAQGNGAQGVTARAATAQVTMPSGAIGRKRDPARGIRVREVHPVRGKGRGIRIPAVSGNGAVSFASHSERRTQNR